MLVTLTLILLASVAAGSVAAVSGFGIGSIVTPLLLLWFPAPQAVALVALPHAWASALRCWRLRRDIHRLTFLQFGLASTVGGLAGALFQARLGGAVLTGVLGGLLLLAGGSEILERRLPLPPQPAFRLAGGFLSGVFGGLVGNQGGIRAAALLGFALRPIQLVATSTASALLVDVGRVPIYLYRSVDLLYSHVPLLLTATFGVTVGTFAGVPLLSRMPERSYHRLIGFLLVLLGVGLLVAALVAGA